MSRVVYWDLIKGTLTIWNAQIDTRLCDHVDNAPIFRLAAARATLRVAWLESQIHDDVVRDP